MRRLLTTATAVLLLLTACSDDELDIADQPEDTAFCEAARELEAQIDTVTTPDEMIPAAEALVLELDDGTRADGETWLRALEAFGSESDNPVVQDLDAAQQAQGRVVDAIESRCPTVDIAELTARPFGPRTP